MQRKDIIRTILELERGVEYFKNLLADNPGKEDIDVTK